MVFSDTERDFLEQLKKGNYQWLDRKYPEIYYEDFNGTYEEWEKMRSQLWKRKDDYYRQLLSRIRKKKRQMKKDLDLYYDVIEKRNNL